MTFQLQINPEIHTLLIPCCTRYLPHDIDNVRYRSMARSYRKACETRPFMNRSAIGLAIGAKAFKLRIDELQSECRAGGLVEARQKIMAFCRVVSIDTPNVNPWRRIAHTFHRHHSTVIHATHKFGAEITEALQGADQ